VVVSPLRRSARHGADPTELSCSGRFRRAPLHGPPVLHPAFGMNSAAPVQCLIPSCRRLKPGGSYGCQRLRRP
jgi:hypothetical protein